MLLVVSWERRATNVSVTIILASMVLGNQEKVLQRL